VGIFPNTGNLDDRPGAKGFPLFHSPVATLSVVCLVLVMSPGDASSGDPPDSSVLDSFWSKCQQARNLEMTTETPRIRQFGRDKRVSSMLIELIAAGEKNGTFTSPWIFEGDWNTTPVVGGYSIVTDLDAKPRLVLKTIAVHTMRFDEISEKETSLDGPAVRALEVWRDVHWAYFERELAMRGKVPSMRMPVTIEEFEVVCDEGNR